MKGKIIDSTNNDKTSKEKLAQNYLTKYARELQVHFNLSDCSLRKIFSRTSNSIKCENYFQMFMIMLKSLLENKENKEDDNNENKKI